LAINVVLNLLESTCLEYINLVYPVGTSLKIELRLDWGYKEYIVVEGPRFAGSPIRVRSRETGKIFSFDPCVHHHELI
jgi:hypothetical protein